jgi:1-acyl-sn-glycerol-3-phosphate acyltransferase
MISEVARQDRTSGSTMNAVLSLWTWTELILCTVFGFCVQLVLFACTAPFDRRRQVAGRWFRIVGIIAARLTPYWRFGTDGAVPRRIAPRTVVVSNHESQADPFLISHLPWEMKWLGKEALFRVPFLGWSMWLAGDVPVRRGTRASVEEAMVRCARWLDRGVPVMIFPEGTRSSDGALGPFKDGAFRLAIEAGAELLPIAVSGTRRALPKHSWRFGLSRARVAVGRPIPTVGRSLTDVEPLKAEARAQIEAMRARLESGS